MVSPSGAAALGEALVGVRHALPRLGGGGGLGGGRRGSRGAIEIVKLDGKSTSASASITVKHGKRALYYDIDVHVRWEARYDDDDDGGADDDAPPAEFDLDASSPLLQRLLTVVVQMPQSLCASRHL